MQKSVGFFLLSNENHSEVWTDLNYLIRVAHLWVFVFRERGVKEDAPGGGPAPYLLSDSLHPETAGAFFQISKKSTNH